MKCRRNLTKHERKNGSNRENSRSLTDITIVIRIVSIHKFEKSNFDLSLRKEWTFVFNDLDRDVLAIGVIECFDNLEDEMLVELN